MATQTKNSLPYLVRDKAGGAFTFKILPAIAILFTCITAIVVLQASTSIDIIWQFWIARQMEGGIKIYAEIVELNPPLWFWMAQACQKLAFFIPLLPVEIYKIIILMICFIICINLPTALDIKGANNKVLIYLAGFYLLALQPLNDFGQREHLTILFSLPYILLIGRRAQGHKTSISIAALIGLVAALGLSLKHYFVFVPVFLELWLLYRSRNILNSFRPETITLGGCGILYACLMGYFTPSYFTEIIPLTSMTYGGYETPFLEILSTPHIRLWGFTAITLWMISRHTKLLDDLSIKALFIAGSGFLIAFIAQKKGWPYHAIPVSMILLFAMSIVLIKKGQTALVPIVKPLCLVVFALSLLPAFTYGFLPAFITANDQESQRDQLETYLGNYAPGTPVLILTNDHSLSWPLVEDYNFQWVSRYYSFWMLGKLEHTREITGTLPDAFNTIANDVRMKTIEDIRCNPPEIIASLNYTMSSKNIATNATVLDFMQRSPQWHAFFMTHYHQIGETEAFDFYAPIKPIQATKLDKCRTIY